MMPPAATPLVSVVTPFYNIASFLPACIESVLAQTYGHFEYILVDNCSTDGSAAIAAGYAERDPRVTVYRNPAFLSQVENYNAALARISPASVYTKIVEADNWLMPECLERLVALARENPSVGLLGSYCITERSVRMFGLHYGRSVWPGREIARRQLLQEIYVFAAPTTVMMRSDLVRARSPFYDASLVIGEDQSACFDLLRDHDFGFVQQILAFIRTDNVSILSAVRDLEARSLDVVVLLARHGREFLDAGEFDRELARAKSDHYRILGRELLLGKGRRLLHFHRRGLASVGLTLGQGRLALAVLRAMIVAALRPLTWWRELQAARTERRRTGPG